MDLAAACARYQDKLKKMLRNPLIFFSNTKVVLKTFNCLNQISKRRKRLQKIRASGRLQKLTQDLSADPKKAYRCVLNPSTWLLLWSVRQIFESGINKNVSVNKSRIVSHCFLKVTMLKIGVQIFAPERNCRINRTSGESGEIFPKASRILWRQRAGRSRSDTKGIALAFGLNLSIRFSRN